MCGNLCDVPEWIHNNNKVMRLYYELKDKVFYELAELFIDNVGDKPNVVKFGVKLSSWLEHYTGLIVSFEYAILLSKIKQLPILCMDNVLESYFRKYTNVKDVVILECTEWYNKLLRVVSGHLEYLIVIQC